jgi:hypothetical protein
LEIFFVAEWDLDLLGDPVPPGFGKRGRPQHMPTVENRKKVILLAAFDRNEDQIAAALSVSVPTLKKHYFRELRARLEARQRLEGKLLLSLIDQVEKGNVSAANNLYARLDRHDRHLLAGMVADRGRPATPSQPAKGKKAQQREAAGKVQGKFAPPPAPRLVN